jgi:urate oxidase
MASAALNECPALDQVTLSMPNLHRVLVDLQPFGLTNDNELFVPTESPQGMIRATVQREPK